jgi:hypothetical protein
MPLTPDRKPPRVKIVVLDTGIDLTHSIIKAYDSQGRIAEYRDFVEKDQSAMDLSGHATYTAPSDIRSCSQYETSCWSST